MLRPRIAIPTRLYGGRLKDAIAQAAETRADAVELDARNEVKPGELSETGCRQLLHFLDEMRLGVASLRFPTRRTYYDPADLEARVQATRLAMSLARRLGTNILTLRVGRIPDDPESAHYGVLRGVMDDLARYSNQVGTTLAITPEADSPEQLRGLLDNVTSGPLLIDFDPAVFVLAERPAAQALRDLHAAIGHVRARDAVRHVGGSGSEVALGRGEVDWDEILAVLDEAEFRGWITVDRTIGEDPAGDAARAVQYLRTVAMD